MATTRVGVGGPMAAYPAFQPKAATVIVYSELEHDGEYRFELEADATYQYELDHDGEVE